MSREHDKPVNNSSAVRHVIAKDSFSIAGQAKPVAPPAPTPKPAAPVKK